MAVAAVAAVAAVDCPVLVVFSVACIIIRIGFESTGRDTEKKEFGDFEINQLLSVIM